jgi:hypothetical protein
MRQFNLVAGMVQLLQHVHPAMAVKLKAKLMTAHFLEFPSSILLSLLHSRQHEA